jgi:protein-disulfide isomerase
MQRVAAVLIMLSLMVSGGASAAEDKSAFTGTQKEEIKKLVREYILENPGIITEAVDALQAQEEKAKADKQAAVAKARRQELYNPSEGTVIGNPKGDVTVVEFFDYNCGYCKSLYTTIAATLKDDPKIRLVLKEFPILGPSSLTAARAALAARKQNKYKELHIALLSHKGPLKDETIMDVAKEVGLDVKKLQEDMKDQAISDILSKNHSLASDLSIDGTPALFVGNTFVAGAIDKDRLRDMIADARKAGK